MFYNIQFLLVRFVELLSSFSLSEFWFHHLFNQQLLLFRMEGLILFCGWEQSKMITKVCAIRIFYAGVIIIIIPLSFLADGFPYWERSPRLPNLLDIINIIAWILAFEAIRLGSLDPRPWKIGTDGDFLLRLLETRSTLKVKWTELFTMYGIQCQKNIFCEAKIILIILNWRTLCGILQIHYTM